VPTADRQAPAFSAKSLSAYQADDYKSIDELRRRFKADAPALHGGSRPAPWCSTRSRDAKERRIVLRGSIKGPINQERRHSSSFNLSRAR